VLLHVHVQLGHLGTLRFDPTVLGSQQARRFAAERLAYASPAGAEAGPSGLRDAVYSVEQGDGARPWCLRPTLCRT